MAQEDPPAPVHVKGTPKGEEWVRRKGREPGRDPQGKVPYRRARDSTTINPQAEEPIDPKMPQIPPA
jgi:hypothetical protein